MKNDTSIVDLALDLGLSHAQDTIVNVIIPDLEVDLTTRNLNPKIEVRTGVNYRFLQQVE